jgi:hypothetical protein
VDKFTVVSVMGILSEYLPKNTSIAISDHKQYIYYKPSKTVDLKIKPGDPVKQGTAAYKALSTGQKVSLYIDEEVFGVPYFGMSIPIFEKDRPAGAITTILQAKPSPISANFLTIKFNERWYPIPYEQIVYLEAQNRKTKVQSETLEGTHKLNLTELEYLLPNNLFIRVHRSYIINVHFIKEIHPDSHSTFLLIMKNNVKIPVSQTYASIFRRSLNF